MTLLYQRHATVLRPSFPAGVPCSLQAACLLTCNPSHGLGSVGGLEIRAYTGHKTVGADMVLSSTAPIIGPVITADAALAANVNGTTLG